MINRIFDNSIEILTRNLNVRALKHEISISNIANVDTPGYKAFDLIVEDEISKMKMKKTADELSRTHHLHMQADLKSNLNLSITKTDVSKEISLRGDGNTVNMEKEMAELSENNLMYRATADILSRKFQGLLKAIQGGRR